MKDFFRAHLTETLGIDDLDLQDELIGEYKRTFDDSVADMRKAAAAADFERLRRLGHALKGCALNIGHAAGRECALGVETGARNTDLEACRAEIEKLAEMARKLE